MDSVQLVGFGVAKCWPARSKRRGGLRNLDEGLGHVVLREVGIASGWLHRAAKTTRSLQWKDNGLLLSEPSITRWMVSN